jgi:hypothetical protein
MKIPYFMDKEREDGEWGHHPTPISFALLRMTGRIQG